MNNLLTENIDFYYNVQGLMVLTESYLKNRGYCCGNGCLHCPYNYESVPEPSKTILLEERKNRIASSQILSNK